MNSTEEQELRELNEALLVSSITQHELTEQAEKAEAEARASRARFESLFDACPVGMYLVDSQLRIRLVSQTARPVFGDVGQELIGSNFLVVVRILWGARTGDEIVARFRHTLATGEPYVSPEFAAERHDRKVREYYDWQINRISLPDGQYGVVCYFIDVSARVLAEQSLRDSEVQYRRLFETAKDGILILDVDSGKIIDANPFMVGLLGYEHDEFLGKELWEIGLFRDKSESQAAYRELRDKGYVRYEHLPLETRQGNTVDVEFVSNLYPVDRRWVAQCNIRDITERVRLERQTQVQAAALADMGRRKDEFLAMLAHELRNPLAPIVNCLLLLRADGDGTPRQRQARDMIERQVGQLTRLVNDLMEVSRITSGRVRLEPERLDMRQTVERAVGSVQSLIDRRKHDLTVSLPAEPVWLHADPTRMEQVVVNLLTNAAKYTEDGGRIAVTVETASRERERPEECVLRVRDTGIGIAPELLPRIFDLFTQADRSLNRAQGGLGIGLSLVRKLVEMHRGTVEGHSDGLGLGSEFVVRLPVVLLPTPPPTAPEPAEPQPARARRVLVVDDNVDAAESLAELLTLSGHDVRMAHTGPDAVEAAATYLPDVVLLDIGLPGLSGYEVARLLRANPALEGVRLVALTGYGRETDMQLSKEAGFDLHMVKPVNPAKISAAVSAPTTRKE